ncbi:MAG TPA: CopD family protein [Steroidobacteraceae bacterium]|jgi:putative copper resistance protein D|nr:CopD family protein [Steroidobacteraceae bacterium]
MPDVLSVILRALSFVLLFQAAGVAIFVAIFGRRLASSQVSIRRLGRAAAIAGVVLVGAHHALEAARMAGDMSGMLDPTLQGMAWNSRARAALICRLAGLLLIAVGLQGSSVRSTIVAVGGAVLAMGAFTLTGHTSVNVHRGALAGLLMLHLLIVAFWFGALWPLYVASLQETPARAADLIERFTALATWLVPVILVAGTAMAVLLLPNLSALREPYGELLIAKVVGFALLMGLAAANKWRLGPALGSGIVGSGQWFRRSVATEYVLIAAVLTITAVMTSLFSPEA